MAYEQTVCAVPVYSNQGTILLRKGRSVIQTCGKKEIASIGMVKIVSCGVVPCLHIDSLLHQKVEWRHQFKKKKRFGLCSVQGPSFMQRFQQIENIYKKRKGWDIPKVVSAVVFLYQHSRIGFWHIRLITSFSKHRSCFHLFTVIRRYQQMLLSATCCLECCSADNSAKQDLVYRHY